MTDHQPSPLPDHLKIAVLGTPGVGKAALVQGMVQHYGGPAVGVTEVSGTHVVSGSLLCPELTSIPVQLRTFYGAPDFSCLSRLLMEGCHGYLFVADTHPDRISLAPPCLRRFIRDGELLGVDFATIPVAMQYHRTELFPGFRPEDMDHFLKISPARVPRFATSSLSAEESLSGLQCVLRTIVASLAPPRVEEAV
jgi:hypothetical protein